MLERRRGLFPPSVKAFQLAERIHSINSECERTRTADFLYSQPWTDFNRVSIQYDMFLAEGERDKVMVQFFSDDEMSDQEEIPQKIYFFIEDGTFLINDNLTQEDDLDDMFDKAQLVDSEEDYVFLMTELLENMIVSEKDEVCRRAAWLDIKRRGIEFVPDGEEGELTIGSHAMVWDIFARLANQYEVTTSIVHRLNDDVDINIFSTRDLENGSGATDSVELRFERDDELMISVFFMEEKVLFYPEPDTETDLDKLVLESLGNLALAEKRLIAYNR
ncbi:MAG: hypothetical protein AAB966_03140 [Patescibacteria group bacterium]